MKNIIIPKNILNGSAGKTRFFFSRKYIVNPEPDKTPIITNNVVNQFSVVINVTATNAE